jgi:hypothetical protein
VSHTRLICRLRAEHRRIERFIDRLREPADHPTPGWVDRLEEAFLDLRRVEPRHFAIEERILFPLAPWLEAALLEQHRHAEELEAYIEALLPAARIELTDRIVHDLRRAAQELHDVIQIHILQEEKLLFPCLQGHQGSRNTRIPHAWPKCRPLPD